MARTRQMPPPFPPFGKHPPPPMGGRPPAPPHMPASIANSTAMMLVRASHRGFECAVRALETLGLHVRHMPVLDTLVAEGPMSQTQLTEATWIDRTTMVAIIDELEQMGLVERAKDPSDRRAHRVQLTPTGRERVGRAEAAHQSADEALLAPLSPEERQTLRALLTRVIEAGEAEPV